YFNPASMRGRGAWYDEGRFVLHLGDRIMSGGKDFSISEFETKFAYQSRAGIKMDLESKAVPAESAKLLEVMRLFKWERDISATLLSGWCVIAPFAGALQWRPHCWVIGAAGTGKSWILQNVVRVVLGEMHVAVQSNTTEAAIRQMMGGDSLPVVFDEFEAQNEEEIRQRGQIIHLARSASSSDGGQIVKGSSGGKSASYQFRSCMIFGSIGQMISHASDLGRITTMSLAPSTDDEKQANKAKVAEVITEEFAQKLQARMASLLPVLMKNIQVFSEAAGFVMKDTRAGAQVGPMLAGAYMLKRSDVAIMADAISWIEAHDWSEHKPDPGSRDEIQLLRAIMEKTLRIDASVYTRTIGEMIYRIEGRPDTEVNPQQCAETLSRVGIIVKDGGFYLSLSSRAVYNGILEKTPWQTSYGRIAARIPGAKVVKDVIFSSGVK
ncbi:MAG: hypothetical protein ACRC2U_00470, partial [Aeromonas sp.]